MYPKLKNQELTKVMSEKGKELPEEMKLKYIQNFQKEKQKFQEKLDQFRKDRPELVQNSKPSVVHKRNPNRAPKKFQGKGKEVKSSPRKRFFRGDKIPWRPREAPMNECQKFHQDMWSNRELQGLPLRESIVEISRCWQHIPMSQREHYRKQAEELQKQYKVDLEHWLKSLSPEEYVAYRERTSGKRKNTSMCGGSDPKIIRTDVQSPPGWLAQNQGPQAPRIASSETNEDYSHCSWGSEEKKEHGGKAESSSSSDSSSSDEDASSSSSSSSGDTSDSDSN